MKMDFTGKKVLVIGIGLSGIAATKLLTQVHAKVILYDGNNKLTMEAVREKLLLDEVDAEIFLGTLPEEVKITLDLVVISPGVPLDLPFVEELQRRGFPIWGEVELAYHFSKGKIIAITGTNGKTTTTALIGEIMETHYNSVFVVGNIGNPYTSEVLSMKDESITVAEMSSFQLETIHTFRPNVSAILNISPDHLNRHHTMKNYIAAKCNITKNQTAEDTCIINYEDELLCKISKKLKAKVIYFSSGHKLDDGIYLENGEIFFSENGSSNLICHVDELQLLGIHSYENVMAAIAVAMVMNVPMSLIQKAIKSFKAVEHRIEFVAEKKGVKYYNDSKGTNPDAAIKGIQAMVRPTLLIGGGYDKESEYEDWIKSFDGKVKVFVLLGQTREKIAKVAKKCGVKNIILVDSLEEAVVTCAENAESGDAVLLSPACASWGMFKNYEERGNIFKELVHNLER